MAVKSILPATGSIGLLEALAPFIPDQFINETFLRRSHPGPRHYFSAAQLWRTHLLALLTPAHSLNAIVRGLPDYRSWRKFACLDHRHRTPDVRMLNEYRAHVGTKGLRRINEYLLKQLLVFVPEGSKTVAIIDATDLPASTMDKKKTGVAGQRRKRRSEPAHSKPGILDFMSVTKSILYVCGCEVMSQQFCWFR
jgi:hypothetical protein